MLKAVLATLLGRDAIASRQDVASNAAKASADLIAAANADSAAGHHATAYATLKASPGFAARDPRALVAAASVLSQWGRAREAASLGRLAVRQGAEASDEAVVASLCLAASDGESALTLAGRAHEREPRNLEVTKHWATALHAGGRFAESVDAWNALLAAAPDDPGAWFAKADSHARLGDYAGARAAVRRALELDPDNALAWRFVGAIDALEDRFDEAFDAFARAERLPGREATDAFANHAVALFRTGRSAECRALLESELPRRPDLNGHMQLGPTLLAHGEFAEGWRQYEFRWLNGQFATERPAWARAHWEGQDLRGRTVWVVVEQGIGDFLQFSRYFPMLRALGAKVALAPPDALAGIAARIPGIDRLVDPGASVPEHDYFAFLLSLPRAFDTRLDTIPPCAEPLAPRPEHAAKWASRLGPRLGPRVGVVWAGRPEHARDRQRSIPLASLMPVLDVPGVTFVGLQKGSAVVQAEDVPERVDWTNLGPESDDLEDAAAIVAALDLVITVDTSIAHLAGVLAKPVWMLVADPPDFRWGLGGDDTPWYATMRLFRQPVPGDWETPVARVADALRTWIADGALTARELAVRDARPRVAPVERRIAHLARALPTRSGFVQYDPDEPFVGASIERYGEWLADVADLAVSLARAGDVIVESRPGVGMHALPMARRLGDEGHLLLFESRTPIRRMLANNLASHRVGNATLLAYELASGAESVDALALDRLDGMKLDAGTDADAAVDGAQDMLWRCRPWLAIACDDDAALAHRAGRLKEFGYRCWRLRSPLCATSNHARRDDDIFGGRVALTLVALPEERDAHASWHAAWSGRLQPADASGV